MRVKLYCRLLTADYNGKEEIVEISELDKMEPKERERYISWYWERWAMENIVGDWRILDKE